MENILLSIKGILNNFLLSSALTLSLTSIFATIFKDKVKLPFDTFWNKYIVSIWSICFIVMTIFRYYSLHKNKTIAIGELIIVIIGSFYVKGKFTSEIIVIFIRVMLFLFFIEIVF